MSGSGPDESGSVNLFTPEFAACPQPVYRDLVSRCPVAHAPIAGAR